MNHRIIGLIALGLSSCLAAVASGGSIQQAIDSATNGDVVLIEPGVYNETIDFLGKSITVRAVGGADVTTIDATGLGNRCVQFVTGEGRDSVLDGFTLTGGLASSGGGMVISGGASPTVRHCVLSGNTATFDGGAVFCSDGDPLFENCVFEGNIAQNGAGGALVASAGDPVLRRCAFDDNQAGVRGGALAFLDCAGVVSSCAFRGNIAVFDGGAVFNEGATTATYIDCLFSGNTAINGGGGGMVNSASSDVTVLQCTFGGNVAAAGGAVANSVSDPTLTGCILWGNTAAQASQVFNVTSSPVFSFCDVQGSGGSGAGWSGPIGIDGGGNIDADPLYVDPSGTDGMTGTADDDLRLGAGSPCIDAGNRSVLEGDCLVDLDGHRRLADDPDVTDTGVGPPPVIDMGAYEAASDEADCNVNGRDDSCEIAGGEVEDCNENGVPDGCDVDAGDSEDLNENGVPDECEPDCNGNDVPDDLDISSGDSADLNGNGVPDECEPDCNENDVPDDLDIQDGTSEDCNNNGRPDECDIDTESSPDADDDEVPDECAPGRVLFTERTITTEALGAVSVYAADIDSDGHVDVLSASRDDDVIAWYESDGEVPPTFTRHVITENANAASAVHAADLDGDGDADVLSASRADDRIAWYENVGGNPPVLVERTISDEADVAFDVFAADLDGDDDLDVLSASRNDNRVAWYENDGDAPPSFTTRTISSTAGGPVSVHAADLDDDGDADVMSASFDDGRITWYENVGGDPPAFAERLVSDEAPEATAVFAADVNGDGDVDILSSSRTSDTIAWYENDGESPPAFSKHVISDQALEARDVFAVDLDGDGDVDVLSASIGDDKVSWYENLGGLSPAFDQHIVTVAAEGAQSVHAEDLDGDGDPDLVSASRSDDRIAWYEAEPVCCSPDINGDGVVDVDDLVAVILAWGPCPAPPDECPADVNADGEVDVDDLIAVILAWS